MDRVQGILGKYSTPQREVIETGGRPGSEGGFSLRRRVRHGAITGSRIPEETRS